jgi:cytochrome c553
MTLRTALLAALLLASPVALARQGDVAKGRELSTTCAACHGPTGAESLDPSYPIIAGQFADYLRKALTDYRSGARSNAIMATQAQPLSDQDIRDLAAFYASQPSPLQDLSKVPPVQR